MGTRCHSWYPWDSPGARPHQKLLKPALARVALLITLVLTLIPARNTRQESDWGSARIKRRVHAAYYYHVLKGELAEARVHYERALKLAEAGRFARARSRILLSLANGDLAQARYRPAVVQFREALESAERGSDCELTAIARASLAGVYLQLFDTTHALEEAERAVRLRACLKNPANKAEFDLQLGWLYSLNGQAPRALPLFQRAIAEADWSGDQARLSLGWQRAGVELLNSGKLSEAEDALARSYRIRTLTRDPSLFLTRFELARLKLAQGDLTLSRSLVESAIRTSSSQRLPEYLALHLRGSIKRAQGDVEGAVEDYRLAVKSASRWRGQVPPADSLRTTADGGLQRIYGSLIATLMDQYRHTRRSEVAAAAWTIAEANRAASLRERLIQSAEWRARVGPEYWERLAELRRMEAQGLAPSNGPVEQRVRGLRLRLVELEFGAGLSLNNWQTFSENILPGIPLTTVQRVLGQSRALMSFYLGTQESYRWTVTSDGITADFLPPAAKLNGMAADYRKSTADDDPSAAALGSNLYRTLFADPPTKAPHWLLALDGGLFDVPFGALVVPRSNRFLVEAHTLEIVPGSWAVGSGTHQQGGAFLGVGDPVYNRADPRYRRNELAAVLPALFWPPRTTGFELPRLLGSGNEIETCARQWKGPVRLLTGLGVNRGQMNAALDDQPAVVHLATHFVPSKQSADETLIALSLPSHQASPSVEVLTSVDISTWRLRGSIVVLSGCASGAGKPLPGTGLVNLGRAFLSAGASAVIASLWPTPDDTGELFVAFYRNLGRPADSAGNPTTPAAALRDAQLELLRSNGWRGKPSYWAAFNLTSRSDPHHD